MYKRRIYALLADLESTTSHISKRPVFLPNETPYSIPTGGQTHQDVSVPPPVPPPPSAEALNGSLTDQPDSHHSSQQSLGSGQKSSWSRDSSSSPLSHFEEDHVYSFPNKHKTSDSSATMTSALGSNLSELDRLLLELNAVQQSSPSFPTTEEAAPALPSSSITHYENGSAPDILVSPPPQEKPKRNGTRSEESRPTVESLLDELEGSVPPPSSSTHHSDLDTSPQHQARISASCATRELDELMASLSDFKPSSLGSLLDPAGASSTFHHSPVSSSVTRVTSASLNLSHPPASALLPLPAGLELHIDEDGGDGGMLVPRQCRLTPHSPASSLSAASDTDLDSAIEVSSAMLSSQTKILLVRSQSAPSNSSLLGNSSSPSNTTTPSLTSVNTVLDRKSPKSSSPSVERTSPSSTVGKVSCPPESLNKGSPCFQDHDVNFTTPPFPKSLSPPLSTPSPFLVASSASPRTYSPSASSPPMVPSPLALSSTSRQLYEVPAAAQRDVLLTEQQALGVEPSLDEVLDNLLAMSFTQNHTDTNKEANDSRKRLQEVQEELILAADRNCVQPDTFISTTNTLTDESVDGGTDGNGDLDWADEELSVSFHDGLDGTMTPYTERPYTDGSMTPLTEASWMDECTTPSSCPGTPDVALDLPLLQTPSIDRVSATGHIKAVIRRTKEIPNVHPMFRENLLRRKMGPVIVNKNSSQDRLIEELQGKLGIGRSERRHKPSDEWLTEGVIVTSKPQRSRHEDFGNEVDKIMAQGKAAGPGGPPTQVNKLDNMLGSLQSDLNKLGVQTVAKGVCGACCKPIVGQVVTAMGRTWHPEHFVCTHCQEEIGSRNFFEREGQPYCEKDYHNLFSPRCYYCNGPILDKVVTALDRTWHPEHFFCAQCGSFFGPEGFHEKDGKAFCRKDYFDMFAPKCGGCARAILENYISALNCLWHPECFVCRECFTPFVNGSFFEHDGQPYCEVHYHERRGSLCSGCQKPITGRCITAMSKKFHPEHFVCAFCLKQLNKGTFKEQNDKPYCHGCFIKLFS
ncbi:paxillin isoform X3 [Nothobranchius furzeri]|uniref:paxillin isoform X3 n=1 Tax=Nothobranchius furzeri TaxID=105023 RepID=UPI003904D3F5